MRDRAIVDVRVMSATAANSPNAGIPTTRLPRIVFVMPTYYPDTFGGLERQTRILARRLVQDGHQVTILAPTQIPGAAGHDDEVGAAVIRLLMKRPVYLGGRYILSMLRWWAIVFAWLARNRADYDFIGVQHVRLHAAPAVVAGMLFNKPMAGKIGRGGDHFDLKRLGAKRLPFGRIIVWLAKRSRMAFVANSKQIVSDLEEAGFGADRIYRIPNGVEIPDIDVRHQRSADGSLVFVFAGRLEDEKGILQLLTAFGSFVERQPDARLHIFGTGPLEPLVIDIAGSSALRANVSVRGVIDDRASIYQDAAYMILPSDSEGMSNTLLEAMAYGVVPIITHVSGATEMVEDARSGFLLPTNTASAILTGLERAAAVQPDAWAAMSESARNRVVSECGIEVVANAYRRLYERLSDNRRPRDRLTIATAPRT